MTYAFTYSGEGHAVCHGTPPLSLRVGETMYPCPDPAAEWCRFQPEWTLGVHRVVCVNGSGPGEMRVVEVPELGTAPGLLVGLVCAAVVAWVVRLGGNGG